MVTAAWSEIVQVDDISAREGWVVMGSDKPFDRVLRDLRRGVKDNGMAVVTQAGPTGAAKSRGITVPGNRIVGVFNNAFAVKILALSTHAMIEAPLRLYVTENADGTASVSFKSPTYVFMPYVADAGIGLLVEARKLDDIFEAIATAATQ